MYGEPIQPVVNWLYHQNRRRNEAYGFLGQVERENIHPEQSEIVNCQADWIHNDE